MIRGTVVGLQMLVGVVFLLANQPNLEIEFVIDTGFEGALSLPRRAVAALGLPFYQEVSASLANGRRVRADMHRATILWDGRVCDVAVLAMGRRPLLGTALLDGFNLNADFVDAGPLILQRL